MRTVLMPELIFDEFLQLANDRYELLLRWVFNADSSDHCHKADVDGGQA